MTLPLDESMCGTFVATACWSLVPAQKHFDGYKLVSQAVGFGFAANLRL